MNAELLMQEDIPVSAGEDDMRQYYSQLRQYPRLTPEEEQELAKGCAAEDEESIRKMVNGNLRLVIPIARKYAGRGVPLMDLIQVGSIGLIVAAKKFDYTKGFHYSTYATKWIRRFISRYVIDHGEPIRIPVHTAEQLSKLKQAQAALLQENGEPATDAELAQHTGFSEETVCKLKQLVPEVGSLDAMFHEGEDGSLLILVEDENAVDPHEELVREELKRTMDTLLGMLNDRQRQILRLHFGMEDGICYSLSEIGEKLNVSKERVRQLKNQAIEKLQIMGASFGLEDFLD